MTNRIPWPDPNRMPPLLLGAVSVVFGWPAAVLQVQQGIDPSWILGLHLAGDAGLHLGQDVVFTFGPLGSLTRPINTDAWSLLPGMVVRFAAMWTIATLVAVHTRRLLGARWGIVATLLLVPPFIGPFGRGADPELTLVLYVVLLVAMLTRERRPWDHPVVAAIAVLILLAKVSSGITAIGLWALFVGADVAFASGMDRARRAVWFLAAPVALVIGGLATGFSLPGLADFMRNSLELTLGFSEGMHRAHARTLIHLASFAIPVVGLGLAMWNRIRLADDRAARSREVAVALVAIAFAFTRFKYGFTREGPGHLIPAVSSLVLLAVVLWPTPVHRPTLRSPHSVAGTWVVPWVPAALVVVGLAALFVVTEPAGLDPYRPLTDLRAAANDAQSFLLPGEREAERVGAKAKLLTDLAFTPDVLPPPGTLHVDPLEISAIYALDRVEDWRPPPVFQSYSAYTPHLDRLNAQHFLSADAPEWILRKPVQIDQRNPAWDPPRHLLAIACGWDLQAGGGSDWALLHRRTTPRCNALATMPQSTRSPSRLGDWVEMASPDCGMQPTIATVQPMPETVLSKLRSLAWVPPVWHIEAQLEDGSEVSWRWLPAFAGEPMLVRVPDDMRWALLGSSSQIASIRVVRADDVLQGSDLVTIDTLCLPA